MKREIHVVGAVILNGDKIFCAQRGPGKSLAMLWEFPGGKIEAGETPQAALIREIDEEMDCKIQVSEKIVTAVYEYEFGIVHLTTFYCELLEGTPKLTDHIDVKWLPRSELRTLEWAPADIPTIDILVKQ